MENLLCDITNNVIITNHDVTIIIRIIIVLKLNGIVQAVA